MVHQESYFSQTVAITGVCEVVEKSENFTLLVGKLKGECEKQCRESSKIKHRIIIRSNKDSTSGCIPQRELKAGTQRGVCTVMFIAKMEATQVSISRCVGKHNVGYSCNEILFRL